MYVPQVYPPVQRPLKYFAPRRPEVFFEALSKLAWTHIFSVLASQFVAQITKVFMVASLLNKLN